MHVFLIYRPTPPFHMWRCVNIARILLYHHAGNGYASFLTASYMLLTFPYQSWLLGAHGSFQCEKRLGADNAALPALFNAFLRSAWSHLDHLFAGPTLFMLSVLS